MCAITRACLCTHYIAITLSAVQSPLCGYVFSSAIMCNSPFTPVLAIWCPIMHVYEFILLACLSVRMNGVLLSGQYVRLLVFHYLYYIVYLFIHSLLLLLLFYFINFFLIIFFIIILFYLLILVIYAFIYYYYYYYY